MTITTVLPLRDARSLRLNTYLFKIFQNTLRSNETFTDSDVMIKDMSQWYGPGCYDSQCSGVAFVGTQFTGFDVVSSGFALLSWFFR